MKRYCPGSQNPATLVVERFKINFTGEFFAFPVAIKNYVLLWAVLWAAVVVIRWGPRRLS